jgi:3(or 17)beta-hydroxysteroid dehydrogenase
MEYHLGRLAGKVALVTGAASGIGRAVVQRFVAEGASVLAADINETAVRLVVGAHHANLVAYRMDVSEESDWIGCVDETLRLFHRLDIVANMVGVGIAGSIEDFELRDWQKMVAVNLTGSMLACKHGIKGIVKSGGSGAIIIMSSISGISPPGDTPGYATTKGGLSILARSVALHCAAKGYPIRCLSIHPTYVDTAMIDPVAAALGVTRSEIIAKMAMQVPIGRIATPEDVANAVLFAASDEAAMISGSALIVDGAQLAGPSRSPF